MRIRIFDFVILGLIIFLVGWNAYSLVRFSQFVRTSEMERAHTSEYATVAQLNRSIDALNTALSSAHAAINDLSRRTIDSSNQITEKIQQNYSDCSREFEAIYAVLNQQRQALRDLRDTLLAQTKAKPKKK